MLVHSDSNVGPTAAPLWFIRAGFQGAGIMVPFDFTPDLAGRQQEREERKAEGKELAKAKRVQEDAERVLGYVRQWQDDPAVYLCKQHLKVDAPAAVGFNKDRIMAALASLAADRRVFTVEKDDKRANRRCAVTVYRAAPGESK